MSMFSDHRSSDMGTRRDTLQAITQNPPAVRATNEIPNGRWTPNPNPFNYNIRKLKRFGFCTIAMIHYPDCRTFDGLKVLVYNNRGGLNLVDRTEIDPHFLGADTDPIARFPGTEQGWDNACMFAQTLTGSR